MQVSRVIKKHGYTLQDVANKLEIARGTLAQTIASSANPTIGTLRKVADAIGCNMVEFFEDEQNGSTASDQNGSTAKIVCPHCGKVLNLHLD